MSSNIDPTKPLDDVPSIKLDLRNNLQAAKDEIESLQDDAGQSGRTVIAPSAPTTTWDVAAAPHATITASAADITFNLNVTNVPNAGTFSLKLTTNAGFYLAITFATGFAPEPDEVRVMDGSVEVLQFTAIDGLLYYYRSRIYDTRIFHIAAGAHNYTITADDSDRTIQFAGTGNDSTVTLASIPWPTSDASTAGDLNTDVVLKWHIFTDPEVANGEISIVVPSGIQLAIDGGDLIGPASTGLQGGLLYTLVYRYLNGYNLFSSSAFTTKVSTSTATPHVFTLWQQTIRACVLVSGLTTDFEVPAESAAGSSWRVRSDHADCTISVVGDAGSVNGAAGGAAICVMNGQVRVEVESNAGSAPVVSVTGDVFVGATGTGLLTHTNASQGLSYTVTSGTQTFGAVAGFTDGFWVELTNRSGGNITIDGLDANHTLPSNGRVKVSKESDGSLVCSGSGGDTLLDAA